MFFETLLPRLIGFDRLKGKGDRFYIGGEYARAYRAYKRAALAVGSSDYRRASVEGLLADCARRCGVPHEASFPEGGSASEVFVPGIHDLFELALADKPTERAERYRNLGPEFEAGYVALVQGEGERALRHLDAAARAESSEFVIELERGRAASLAGRMKEAEAALARARLREPNDVEGLNLLAAVKIQLGDFAGAERFLSPVDNRGEGTAETFFLLGRALSAAGRRQEALEKLAEAVRREGRFHEAYFEGGAILEAEGDVPGAFRAYRMASSLDPEDISYNRNLARVVLEHGLDVREGLAACDRLMLVDEERHWEYLSWVAELYVAAGWKREARDPLQKAIRLVPAGLVEERSRLERRLAELAVAAP